MSRQSRARRARLWTLAGLTFLSGCGGAASNPPTANRASAPGDRAAAADAQGTALTVRHTLDAAVVPVWFPFEDPPMPALASADGADAKVSAEKPNKEPTVVLPRASAGSFERLPPVGSAENPPPEGDRYGVDSRYWRDGRESEPSRSSEAANPHADTNEAPPAAPTPLGPALDAPSHNDAPRSGGTFQRLPPVEHVPPPASADAAPAFEPFPSVAPDSSAASHSPASPAARPSDLFADEARPTERREYPLAIESPAQPPAARLFQRFDPSATASPSREPSWDPSSTYNSAYAGPQTAQPSEPFVLPPVDASANGEESYAASARPPRHREMQLINERAAEGIRTGFALAHRGALYSAQSEFASALRVVAQALDAQENGNRHVAALAAGLAALEEADDFLASARSSAAPVDVVAIVAKHRTPVLKDAPKEGLTSIAALQHYYTFAQEQLAAAVEHEPAASQALYGLGKIQTTLQASRTGTVADGPKAIALHQAALLVDEGNFMAANELGVLMARCGRFDAARAALAHSVSISPQPAVWRNLAAVHEHLGESALAAHARAAADNYAKSPPPSGSPNMPQQPVVWLDPAAFAQSAQPQADLQRGQPAATSMTPNAAAPSPVPHTSDKKSGFKWPLW